MAETIKAPSLEEMRKHLLEKHQGYAIADDLDGLHWTHSLEHLSQEATANA